MGTFLYICEHTGKVKRILLSSIFDEIKGMANLDCSNSRYIYSEDDDDVVLVFSERNGENLVYTSAISYFPIYSEIQFSNLGLGLDVKIISKRDVDCYLEEFDLNNILSLEVELLEILLKPNGHTYSLSAIPTLPKRKKSSQMG